MKTRTFLQIAFRIVALFTIAMLLTFIPEYLRDFFGDKPFVPYIGPYGNRIMESGDIDTEWAWGARHYWYFFMMLLLFLLSAINVCIYIAKLIDSEFKK